MCHSEFGTILQCDFILCLLNKLIVGLFSVCLMKLLVQCLSFVLWVIIFLVTFNH